MSFTFDENLADAVSRTRFFLLDTDEEYPLLTDEAIQTFFGLYGVDEGTAKLAVGLMNRFGNEPASVTVAGIGVTWGARFAAWQAVIADVRGFGIAGGTPTRGMKKYRVETRDPYHYPPNPYSDPPPPPNSDPPEEPR